MATPPAPPAPSPAVAAASSKVINLSGVKRTSLTVFKTAEAQPPVPPVPTLLAAPVATLGGATKAVVDFRAVKAPTVTMTTGGGLTPATAKPTPKTHNPSLIVLGQGGSSSDGDGMDYDEAAEEQRRC